MCAISADYAATASTVTHHVSGAGAETAAEQNGAPIGAVDVPFGNWEGLILTAESLLDEASAVL